MVETKPATLPLQASRPQQKADHLTPKNEGIKPHHESRLIDATDAQDTTGEPIADTSPRPSWHTGVVDQDGRQVLTAGSEPKAGSRHQARLGARHRWPVAKGGRVQGG